MANVSLNIPLNPEKNQNYTQEQVIGTSTDKGYKEVPTVSGFSSVPSPSFLQKIKNAEAETILKYMRFINIVLAVFQGFAGTLGLFELVTFNITSCLIAVYVILFALILLAFECRFQSLEETIRVNFGFLYTYRGRVVFIFFVGFLDFGIKNSIGWIAGVLMCANALFNLFVLLCHPSFQNGELQSTMDPTLGYSTGDQEATSLLAQNPDLVKQAGSIAFQQAQKNPELAKKAGNFVVQQAMSNPEGAIKIASSMANENVKNQGGSGYLPPNPTN